MCAEVQIQVGASEAEWEILHSVNDLRGRWEVLPEDVWIPEGQTFEQQGDSCLCNVEVEQILTRAGVRFVIDDVWGDYAVPLAEEGDNG